MGSVVNIIVVLIPIPVIAALVAHDVRKNGSSRRTWIAWAIGSIMLFPIVPLVYLAVRNKSKDDQGKTQGPILHEGSDCPTE